MKALLSLLILGIAAIFWWLDKAGSINLCRGKDALYSDSLQTALLGGLLAIAGFLLSTKTFILVHMKNEVFDSQDWRDDDLKARRTTGRSCSYYRSLEQLASFLELSILASLLASSSHLVTVFIRNSYTVSFALSLSVSALLLLGGSWYLISSNLKTWFSTLNKREKQRIHEELSKKG
jgi:hypothetical protein